MNHKLVAVAFVLLTWSHPAAATLVACKPIEAKGVLINHCSNHGYYPRSLDFELPHAASGLAELRKRLIAQGKLSDRPILIELPAFPQSTPSISRTEDCAREIGDAEDDGTTPPSNCYRIDAGKITPSYDALRTLVTALTTLSVQRAKRDVNDLKKLEREVGRFQGIVLPQKPIPSPSGKLALLPVWRDGTLELSITSGGARLRQLPELRGYLAAAPRWSRDGRRLVYASLLEANVHDTDTAVTTTFTLSEWIGNDIHQVAAAFDTRGKRLVVTGDTNLFNAYRVWIFEIDGTRAARATDENALPDWAERFEPSKIDKVASLVPLR